MSRKGKGRGSSKGGRGSRRTATAGQARRKSGSTKAAGGSRASNGRGPNERTAATRHSRARIVLIGIAVVLVPIVVAVVVGAMRRGDSVEPAAPAARPAAVARFENGDVRQRPEFEAIAEQLWSSEAMFFGRGRARAIQLQIARPEATLIEKLAMGHELVHQQLRDGDVARAVTEIERIFDVFERRPGLIEPEFHRLRGLVYLRQAEIENCVRRHNAECCLFPLAGGGVHSVRSPADEARRSYEAYLAERPDDLTVRWLLNVTAMALGDWPVGVPPAHVLPPSSFDSEDSVPRFRDVAPELGLDTFNLCGGCIVEDFDNDGLLDVVSSTLDPTGPMTYHRNTGNGFEDRSTASHLDDQLGGLNTLAADYDDDGDMDVLVLRGAWLFDSGRIRNSLLRNNGDGTFTDVTRAAGLAEPAAPTQAATFGDFDNDGDLDLYVANESRDDRSMFSAEASSGGSYPSNLFRNEGDGTFTDVAAAAGAPNDRYAKGVTAGDFDNDGDIDLYVSNVGRNRLYRNDTVAGAMRFTDVAAELNVTEPARESFATWFFDYDNDGWLDLFVAAYDADVSDLAARALGVRDTATRPRLYRNTGGDGAPGFADVTVEVGLDRPILPMGANFGDVDNDGFLDLYLTTGRPDYEAIMPNVMLRNDGGRRFLDVSQSAGVGHLQKGHGVAFADIDDDGDQDIYHQLGGFFTGDAFHNALFLNPGNDNHHLVIELVGTRSNRFGLGARIAVTVSTPDGTRTIHRACGSVGSFGGSPVRQEIGLGDAEAIKSVVVEWPASGTRQVLEDVALDSRITVAEGQ